MERGNNDFTVSAAIDLSISLAVFPTCPLLRLPPSFPQLNPTATGQIPAAPVLSDRVRASVRPRRFLLSADNEGSEN